MYTQKKVIKVIFVLALWLLFLLTTICAAESNKKEKRMKTAAELGYEIKSGNTDKEAFAFKGNSIYITAQTEIFFNVSYNYEISKNEKIW